MKTYLKKLSKLLSISLSLAIVLTLLPIHTVEVQADDSSVTFLYTDATSTSLTKGVIKVESKFPPQYGGFILGKYFGNVQGITISTTSNLYVISKVVFSEIGMPTDSLNAKTGWILSSGSVSTSECVSQNAYMYKTLVINNINSSTFKINNNNLANHSTNSPCISYKKITVYYNLKHAHNFTFTSSGDTITAKCTSDCDNADYKAGYTVKINKPAHAVYNDGKSAAATVTPSSNWPTSNLPGNLVAKPTSPTITYKNRATSATLSSAPTNAGSYSASITIGGQTATVNYEIGRANVSIPTNSTDYTYTGSEQTFDLTVNNNAYTISNNKRTNVGEQTVTLALNSNYKWSDNTTENKTYTFKINPAEIGSATRTLSYVRGETNSSEVLTYDGNEVEANISLSYNGLTLVEGVDYEITEGVTEATDAGFYKVEIAGKGNFTGHANIEWEIKGKSFDDGFITVTSYDEEYDGAYHSISVVPDTPSEGSLVTNVQVKYSNTGAEDSYTLDSPTTYKDAGNYKVYYKVTADNHEPEIGFATVDIAPKTVDVTWVENTLTFTYDGQNHKPTANVASGGIVAGDGQLEVIVEVNGEKINAGTHTATAVGLKVNGETAKNYRLPFHEPTHDFTINKAKVFAPQADPKTAVGGEGFTYNESEQTYALVTDTDTNDVTSYVDKDYYTVAKDKRTVAGTQYVTATLIDEDNYEWTTDGTNSGGSDYKSFEFTIKKRPIERPALPTITDFTYNRKEQTYALVENNALYTIEGNKEIDAKEYTVYVALNDTDNNEWIKEGGNTIDDQTYPFVIKPLDIGSTSLNPAKVSIVDTHFYDFDVNEGEEIILDFDVLHELEGTTYLLDPNGGKDYTFDGHIAAHEDTHTLTVTFQNNFTGSITKEWVISADKKINKPVENPDDFEGEATLTVNEYEEQPNIEVKNPLDFLTEEDIEKLKDGNKSQGNYTDIEIILFLNEKEKEYLDEKSLEAIEEVLKNPTAEHYYDITVRKVIKTYKNNSLFSTDNILITETSNPVIITIDLPTVVEKVKGGYTRKYSVIRSHKNSDSTYTADVLEPKVVDAKNIDSIGALTFESDKFSDYVLAYKDTRIPYKAPDTSVR